MTGVSETTVEDAALEWLSVLGWSVAYGPEISPGGSGAERKRYDQVVLEHRLRGALARFNPLLPREALDEAIRKLTRPEGTTLEVRNRAFHRLLASGVTVEYRDDGGELRGAQVQVFDCARPEGNDWLAVNQFSVTENRNTRRPDIVLFVNGLPLGLIELKNPADERARRVFTECAFSVCWLL